MSDFKEEIEFTEQKRDSNADTEKSADEGKKHSKLKDILDAVLFAAIVALFLKTFVVEAYRIPTGSMENTLLIGDFLLVNKFMYGPSTPRNIPFTNIRLPYISLPSIKEPERGDIVVFEYPGAIGEIKPKEVLSYIKRLIGLPGDTVFIKQQILYVNGKEFPKPEGILIDQGSNSSDYNESNIFPEESNWNRDYYGPLYIPKKGDVIEVKPSNFKMWEMLIIREGHTIRITADNKVFIDEKESQKYKIEKDYCFVMGDHRTNSLDSRYWGFLARENIIGEALMVYWSWEPNIPFSEPVRLINSTRWDRIAKFIY